MADWDFFIFGNDAISHQFTLVFFLFIAFFFIFQYFRFTA
jgi:hypothetical protein